MPSSRLPTHFISVLNPTHLTIHIPTLQPHRTFEFPKNPPYSLAKFSTVGNTIMPSRQRQTVDTLIRASNHADVDAIRTLFSPKCIFRKLPAKFKIMPYSYNVFIKHTRSSFECFSHYQFIANEIIEDTQTGHIAMRQTTITDTTDHQNRVIRESFWTLRFDEAGEKIVELTELWTGNQITEENRRFGDLSVRSSAVKWTGFGIFDAPIC